MREERVLKSSEVECTGRNKGGCRKTLMAQGSRERERDGKEEAVGDKKQKNKVKKTECTKDTENVFVIAPGAPILPAVASLSIKCTFDAPTHMLL